MHYHLLLTELCNSQCRYCYTKSLKEFDNGLDKKFKFCFDSPEKSKIDVKKLKEFLSKDKDPVLVFYGGEPLMEIDKIMEVIDELEDINIKFRIQTNGKLLNELPPNYLHKIDKMLVSLDGDKQRTDLNRGEGTFDLVLNNIRKIRQEGYKGEIVARMTISQDCPDLYQQVLFLVSLIDKKLINSIHWQLDAGFYKFDFNKKDFEKFVKEYNLNVSKLIDYWIKEMYNGRVLVFYPFIAIIESLLKKEKTLIRCGAGHSGYAITTNGKVVACPIMNCIEDFKAGDLESNPNQLKKFSVSGNCEKCSYLDLCGGRCLYWNKSNLWPEEGDKLICKTIKFYIDKLKDKMPVIKELIKNKTIKEKDFEYEKYFGPEIIP